MDIEQKQAELIDHFVNQASTLKGSALWPLIIEATSHPSLFAFSEILSVPTVSELEGTENSLYLDVLRLFAHGTWSDYKINAVRLPQLVPDQVLKLKQLTVLTLAEVNKVLPYDQLMQELDVTNVRELEDFLINEGMYAGIVRGKLDQLRRCFEVQFAAGRDLRPGQLGNMLQTLSNWLATSDNLLVSIQEKIKWADSMSELDKKHRKDVEDRVEEVKKSLSLKADIDYRGHEETYSESGGVMDYEEDRSRPKRYFDLASILVITIDPEEEFANHEILYEMELLRDLYHPNIVKCHNILDRNGEDIQVLLELMDGESLAETHIANFGVSKILSQTLNPKDFVGTIRFRYDQLFNCVSQSLVETLGHVSPERMSTGWPFEIIDSVLADVWSIGLKYFGGLLDRYPIVEAGELGSFNKCNMLFAPSASTIDCIKGVSGYYFVLSAEKLREAVDSCRVVAAPVYNAEAGKSVVHYFVEERK
ncbi:unnamed protein product [Dovyalis caffra]|uniref:COP9 signalosome complex subunit 7 n=1 Tax=Dovyalis caffra TaxID=77055 RepID=A0AAV1SBS8_9ROSI|nr:unnamed protein product [Dovyalis caffra]